MVNDKVLKMTVAIQKLINRLVKDHPEATKWPETTTLRLAVQDCLSALAQFKSAVSEVLVTAEEMAELLKIADDENHDEEEGHHT